MTSLLSNSRQALVSKIIQIQYQPLRDKPRLTQAQRGQVWLTVRPRPISTGMEALIESRQEKTCFFLFQVSVIETSSVARIVPQTVWLMILELKIGFPAPPCINTIGKSPVTASQNDRSFKKIFSEIRNHFRLGWVASPDLSLAEGV